MDFAVPVDHRVKIKEIEKKEKCLDYARKLCNMAGAGNTICN